MMVNILRRCRNIPVLETFSYNLVLRCCSQVSSHRIDQFDILKQSLDNSTVFSKEVVDKIKLDVFNAGTRINSYNFDSLFMETCIQNNLFHVAKDFFHHVFKTNDRKVSLALVRKYFRLCYFSKENCDDVDKKFLLTLYYDVKKDYPLLDDTTCECLSMGLSITDEWREGIKLLNMSKMYGNPTNLLYSSIITAAFYNGDESLGWSFFEEMIQNEKKPHVSVYSAIIHKLYDSTIVKLFSTLENCGLYLPSETASVLAEHKGGKITTITPRGVCRNCQKSLSPIKISEHEFKELTEDFLNPVLIGKDIFIKSKPTELNNFKMFLKKSSKVDVVLDGLNISYSGSKKNFSSHSNSKMLMNVLNHFLKNNLKVMILGRNHMKSWSRSHMNFIKNNAYLFLAEDLSSDDPFLLYATMFNGLGTKFVSRDLMRGHKFLLRTPQNKKIFSKWQQKHQLFLRYIEKNGTVHLNDISKYLFNAQCSEHSWHVPIISDQEPGVHPSVQALNMKWICIHLDMPNT